MADLVWSDPDPEKEDFAISPRWGFIVQSVGTTLMLHFTAYRGAGYTFGSGVVYKFLETNNMSHILRAHQLCMEGFASLFDGHLSTVWSAPNYCYRCGNSASILEVRPDGERFFNVFQAAPENDRDGPSHQAQQNAGGKVRSLMLYCMYRGSFLTTSAVTRVLLINYDARGTISIPDSGRSAGRCTLDLHYYDLLHIVAYLPFPRVQAELPASNCSGPPREYIMRNPHTYSNEIMIIYSGWD